VVGIPLSTSVLIVGVVTTVYTTVGGLKAVVWTHLVQFAIVILGITLVIITSFYGAGGASEVLALAGAQGRLQVFDFSLDPAVS